jgi:hypothetical protein
VEHREPEIDPLLTRRRGRHHYPHEHHCRHR